MKEEDPSWIMGFQLVDDPQTGTVSISHQRYIETAIKRFRLTDAHPVATPMDHSTKLLHNDSPQSPDDIADMRNVPYREIVGSALWTSLVCTPQITYSVGQVARFAQDPGRPHWEATKRIIKYLKGKLDYALILGGDKKDATILTTYSDSNWAEDIDDRRSVSGYVIKLGQSVISWNSK
jgi:hypothetical protein